MLAFSTANSCGFKPSICIAISCMAGLGGGSFFHTGPWLRWGSTPWREMKPEVNSFFMKEVARGCTLTDFDPAMAGMSK